ncbi:transcriptional regulator [Mycobacterium lentiflavum]|uniref:Transcriptional regulator n=1 Tax=Mycobacterium lentiflavum TaxID=141349 RepID=A0A0E3WCM2_MYCLN|nr:TetR/AcrR family transcriptional regulator [Mycobacterium lentiflavum]CQD14952.1 transcriptional regulator [Mycobacterium lentiflavum]
MAVIDAARKLFAKRGYFNCTINEIADASRVSAGTVYAQCGGKQGLLKSLMDIWTTAPLVQETLDRIGATESLDEFLDVLGDSYFQFYRRFDDIVQIVVTTAAHDGEAAAALIDATHRHRSALHEIARKARALGGCTADFSDDDFADIVLYHYGPQNGFHFTVKVLGWPEQRARAWISGQLAHALQRGPTVVTEAPPARGIKHHKR